MNIAPIGDNLRDPLDTEISVTLKEFIDAFEARAGEIERARVTNDDEAGRATALGGILADIIIGAEKKRVEMKEPFLTSGRKIDGRFGAFIALVTEAKTVVVSKIGGYRAEQRRLAEAARLQLEQEAREQERAAQEAARAGNALQAAKLEQRAEQSAASAAVIIAPSRPIRSAYGQTASGREVWKHEITSRKLLPAQVLNHPKVTEAINIVIGAMVRSGTREIPGVRIYPEEKTVIRR